MDIKQAGRELIKGNVGNAFKALAAPRPMPVNPSSYRGGIGKWFFNANGLGRDIYFTYTDLQSSLTAYDKCAPLNAIVTKKAKALINGKTWVLDKKGKEVKSEPAERIRSIMANPNPLQSWADFEMQQKVYEELFGYSIILAMTPVGFDNTYAKSIWLLPPQYVDIEERTDVRLFDIKDKRDLIRQIRFSTPDGHTSIIDSSVITIQSTITPSVNSLLLPQNPVRPLTIQINNIIGAYESRGTLISYRGALGAISPDNVKDAGGPLPLTATEKSEIQEDFLKYGLLSSQLKFIISSAAIKWTQIGIPTRDLMLFEEIEDDIQRICDSKDFPYELLSSTKGVTFSNKNEANKSLYQNTTIPEGGLKSGQWMKFFNCEYYGLKIEKDFSHLPVLQEDKQKSATARYQLGAALDREFKNNWITLNRVLEILEEDPIGEEGNKYYKDLLAEGWVFGAGGVIQLPNQNQNNGQEGAAQNN